MIKKPVFNTGGNCGACGRACPSRAARRRLRMSAVS